RHVADGPDLAREIEDVTRRLGRAVKFPDLLDLKTTLKGLPHVRAHAVADRNPERVILLGLARRRIDQVAAELADVQHGRRAVALNIGPKSLGAEAFPHCERGAGDDARPRADQERTRVI